MEELKIKIGDKDVSLKPEISEYFETVSIYVLIKEDVNKSLQKVYNGEYTFFESILNEKINKNIDKIKDHITEKLNERNIEDANLDVYIQRFHDEIDELFDENYNLMVEEVKKYAPDTLYDKIDEFKKSQDRNIDLIIRLAEQYNATKEIDDFLKTTQFPIIIKKINASIDELYNSLLNVYVEKVGLQFDVEKSKLVLQDLELKEDKKEAVVSAIEAYPLSIVENSKVLLEILEDPALHDEMVRLIKFVHAEKRCFNDIPDAMREDFYKDSLENHKEKYKNIFYKCLRYREEIGKTSTMDTIERCYTDIYKDVLSKVETIEDLILAEGRICYLCSILSKNKEEIMLKLLNRIENINIQNFHEKKKDVVAIDKTKLLFTCLAYVAILVILMFVGNQSIWDKVILIYIYLFFGFIAFAWYANMLNEYKNKYVEVFTEFMNITDKKEKYAGKIIDGISNENSKAILSQKYLIKSPEVVDIIKEYNSSLKSPLMNLDKARLRINNKSKGVGIVPIVIIVLFLIWIVLIICNGIFAPK